MKKLILALICTLPLVASAQDYRTGNQALVSGVTGYPSHAESPANVSVTGTTAKTTAIPAYVYVRLTCTGDVFFKFGDQATVTAALTDVPFNGNPEVFNMGPNTGIAFISASTATCNVLVLR